MEFVRNESNDINNNNKRKENNINNNMNNNTSNIHKSEDKVINNLKNKSNNSRNYYNKTPHSKFNLSLQVFSLLVLCAAISIEASPRHKHHPPILISRHNDTSIKISWERFANQRRLKKFSCGVEYFKVKLRFNDKTVQNWQVVDNLRSLQIDDHYLKELKAVQVRALMCDGDTVYKTSWVKIESSDHHKIKNSLEPPSSLTVVSIENNILVRWQANTANSGIEGYIVSYGEKVPDIMFKYVSRDQNNVTLDRLKYSTVYVVGIRTFYNHLQSEALYKSIKTKKKASFGLQPPRSEASSLPSPTLLRLKTLSSRSIELEWKDPSLYGEQIIMDERFYVVHYTNMKSHQNTSIIVKALHVTIHNLQADCWYIFKVRIGKGALSSLYTDGIPGKTLKMDLKNRGYNRKHDKEKRQKKQYQLETKKERKIKRHQRNHKAYRMPFKSHLPYYHPSFKRPALSLQKRQIINMKKKLLINIGAFITWPRNIKSFCSLSLSNSTNKTAIAISTPQVDSADIKPLYTFRFKRSDEKSFIETNLSDNFKYVNDLSPRYSYIYQVKYLHAYDQGWSQEEVLKLPN